MFGLTGLDQKVREMACDRLNLLVVTLALTIKEVDLENSEGLAVRKIELVGLLGVACLEHEDDQSEVEVRVLNDVHELH